jgi:two-component system, NtrC family, nitrogen regulation response regulator NtrX
MARKILIIDDEKSILQSLQGALEDEGYQVFSYSSAREGIKQAEQRSPDVILLDIWMPEMDGLEALQLIKSKWPDQSVIMMSGHGTIETAVKATKFGAFDFAEKPLSLEKILLLIQNACKVSDLARENKALRKHVEKKKQLIGESPPMTKIKELIKRAAPTTGSVLVTGENGTGKELVAHSIHALSDRYKKPFVDVNCAAIPEELIESELFGHEKGAFTGATQLRRGKFDLADEGTLFLDEIGDMSLKTQAKILRILQEQKFERVGGTQTISVNVRIIAATNKDLKEEIKKGRFREDLFYRLNVLPFQMPALRDRREDIALLAGHFLKEFSISYEKKLRHLTPEALKVLHHYDWPGNVRELRNLIERLLILTPSQDDANPIEAADLLSMMEDEVNTQKFTHELKISEVEGHENSLNDLSARNTEEADASRNLRDARQEFEKQHIIQTLKEQEGNISKAAAVLGIERSHLHKKIKSYGIDPSAI